VVIVLLLLCHCVIVLFGMAHSPLKFNTADTKTISYTITSTAVHLKGRLRLYQDTKLDSYVYIIIIIIIIIIIYLTAYGPSPGGSGYNTCI
jgi:hypothetical protein